MQNEFNFYTIVYNFTNLPNGFLDTFNSPLPSDPKLLRLKMLVDNAYLSYYSIMKNQTIFEEDIPKLKNIFSQPFPSPPSRFNSNSKISSAMGSFYLYFPPMILFAILLLDLVKEKESMLKNYTNLYGLSNLGYWLSWFIIAIISSSFVSFLIVILGKFIFYYDIFTNVNGLVSFYLFFLFSLSMQVLAMFFSCMINSTSSATTFTYSVILIGIVVQCFFTNYGLVYFFFATDLNDLWLLVKCVLLLLHFYPPFLFSVSYLTISRICSFHFDSPKLQWVSGRYFSFNDIFVKESGKLRLGVNYEVNSIFQSYFWFMLIILFFSSQIALFEMNQSYKYENSGIFSNFLNLIKLMKNLYSLTSLKKLNIKKIRMEDTINKSYEKFLKSEKSSMYNDEKLTFIVQENHFSVIEEKKIVANLNKRSSVPEGIRILAIEKTFFNGFQALSDVNIEISKGEIFTILGPNGAGKSTLINILTNQLSSSEGFAKVGPFIIHSEMFLDSVYLKRMMGICSQFDYFWEDLSVSEILYIYSKLRGIDENRISLYIDEKISEVGLENKKNEKVSKLSGGMRRRLSICISTIGDPFIIFMDEPTSGLDPNNRRKIWQLINKIKENRVIILTTHLMDEAEYLSDRIGVIVKGKLRFIGNCTDLRTLHWDGIILNLSKFFLP
jgi:ABC-type multidrug transport system ATPase subunit